MPLSPIDTASFRKIAVGIDRPEDVVVSLEGRVFASDHQCAVAEILPDGSFVRMGPQGGAPNGINMDRDGRILIANFGIYDRQEGPLQRFDPATGVHETLVSEVGGRRLTSANYPIMDRDGNIWCANSTHADTWPRALDGRADGFLFVLRPDGTCEIVAEGLKFPNGLALSADHGRLFCAQTSAADVLVFDVLPGGRLGPGVRYGPVLGQLAGPGLPPAREDPAANKVIAITPSGEKVTMIHDPSGEVVNHPTNVTWGGADLRDLYIGSIRAAYVLKGRSPVAGMALVHQA